MLCVCQSNIVFKNLQQEKLFSGRKDQRRMIQKYFFPSSLSANAWLNNKTGYQYAFFYTACLLAKNLNILELNITHPQTVFFSCIHSGSTCFSPVSGYSNCAFSHAVSNLQAPSARRHVTNKSMGWRGKKEQHQGQMQFFWQLCVSANSWRRSNYSNICNECGHTALTPTKKSFWSQGGPKW